VRGDDYRIRELQERYAGHFLPYIQKKIDEEARAVSSSSRSNCRDFSAAAVPAFHEKQAIDVAAHNQKELAALITRLSLPFKGPNALTGPCDDQQVPTDHGAVADS